MLGTASWFCSFPDAYVNNENKKIGPKAASAKFYNHKHIKIQNLNEYTEAKPIL